MESLCEKLFDVFKKNGISFFTGVPDSILKDWVNFLANENGKRLTNMIACNECEAIALAAGHYLATSNMGVVYMSNAGLGKAVNPITSLCDPYKIPMVLMIGWRGRPDKEDEPQHEMMGKITLKLLRLMDIEYMILSEENMASIDSLITTAKEQNKPIAIVINKDAFEPYGLKCGEDKYEMTREDAIKTIMDNLGGSEVIISTTGKTSRELYEYRAARGEPTKDFYTIGSMGCASSIAHAIALQKPEKRVIIFDGDGSVLMQMGALATIGHYKPKNLYHIVFDNESHDSTGGQPTVSTTVNFVELAKSLGYNEYFRMTTRKGVERFIKNLDKIVGPVLLLIKIKKGSRKDLSRPTTSPTENKRRFMDAVSRGDKR